MMIYMNQYICRVYPFIIIILNPVYICYMEYVHIYVINFVIQTIGRTPNIANHVFCHLKNIFSAPFNLPSYTARSSAVFSAKNTLHRLILSLSCMMTGASHSSLERWAILSGIRENRYT